MFLKNFNTDEFVKTRGSETLPGYLAKCLRKLTERGNVGIVRMTDCLQAGPKVFCFFVFLFFCLFVCLFVCLFFVK